MRITVVLLFVIVLLPRLAVAFEFEGYKSGMSRAEVEKKASEYGKLTKSKEDLIVNFYDGSYLSFNFCKERLVSMQQGQPPSLRQFSMILEEFNKALGQPITVQANSRASPKGQIREMGFWWGGPEEYISMYYITVGEEGESLSTSRQVKNACFKVPR